MVGDLNDREKIFSLKGNFLHVLLNIVTLCARHVISSNWIQLWRR